jgi:hypothetical protein
MAPTAAPATDEPAVMALEACWPAALATLPTRAPAKFVPLVTALAISHGAPIVPTIIHKQTTANETNERTSIPIDAVHTGA